MAKTIKLRRRCVVVASRLVAVAVLQSNTPNRRLPINSSHRQLVTAHYRVTTSSSSRKVPTRRSSNIAFIFDVTVYVDVDVVELDVMAQAERFSMSNNY